MIPLTSLVIATLFGAGAHLMLRRDAIKLAGGSLLVSNAAVLLLISSGMGATEAPLVPISDIGRVPDPVVQALGLTAVVIGFATTLLLLRIAMAVARSHDTVDMEDLVEAEVQSGEAEDQESERPEDRA